MARFAKFCLKQLEVRCSGLFQVILGFALFFQLLILAVTILQGYTPFLQDKIESKLSEALGEGLEINWDAAYFELDGSLFATGVKIIDSTTRENFLDIESLFLEFSWTDIISGDPLPLNKIKGAGMNLYLPSILSPSGTNTKIIENISFYLSKSGKLINLKNLQFELGQGTFFFKASKRINLSSMNKNSVTDPLRSQYLKVLNSFSKYLSSIPQDIGNFYLSGEFKETKEDKYKGLLTILSENLSYEKFRIKGAILKLRYNFNENALGLESLEINSKKASYKDFSAERLFAKFSNETGRTIGIEDFLYGPFEKGVLTAANLRWQEIEAKAGMVQLARAANRIDTTLNLKALGSYFSAKSFWAPGDEILSRPILFDAEIHSHKIISRIATYINGTQYESLAFDPLDISGKVKLDSSSWSESIAAYDIRLKRFNIGGKAYQAGRIQGRFEADTLNVTKIYGIRHTGEEIKGAYTQNLKTKDFVLTATGKAYPDTVGAYLDSWWDAIFKDIRLLGDPIQADVRVEGNWQNKKTISGITAAHGTNVRFRNTTSDYLETIISHTSKEAYAQKLVAKNKTRGLEANIVWDLDAENPQGVPFYVSFDSNLFWSDLLGIISEEQLSAIKAQGNPNLSGSGILIPTKEKRLNFHQFKLNGTFDQTVQVGRLSFSKLTLFSSLQNQSFRIKKFEGSLFGGFAEGSFKLNSIYDKSSNMIFALNLREADYEKLYLSLNPFTKKTQTNNPKPKPQGIIDLKLTMDAPLNNWMEGESEGYFKITQSNFGTIQLFGELSKIFQSVGLNFSSINVDSAQGTWIQKPYLISIPKILVNGPTLDLDAKGEITLPNYELDFEVQAFAVKNLFGFVMTPISSNLRFNLKGTAENPSWSLAFSPFRWLKPTKEN